MMATARTDPASIAEALHDLQTHARAWRSLLNEAADKAIRRPPDIDDRLYWEHEIEVFDRVVSTLAGLGVHFDDPMEMP